jgi:hypothetical protein
MKFGSKSNSLSCDKANEQSFLSVTDECTTNKEGDPFDILGQGVYATDINCYHKMRVGWIKATDSVTMEIPPSIDSKDFKTSDAERMTLVDTLSYKPSKPTKAGSV